MTTDLSTGSIPPAYRKIYDVCSTNGESIHKDIYQYLLSLCKLNPTQSKLIWQLSAPVDGLISRTHFYKTLALIAWAQQGKDVSDKLFHSFTGEEYPVPEIANIGSIEDLKNKLNIKIRRIAGFNLEAIVQTDSINVQLVPERKGFILKYSEYIVSSRRLNSKVTRRYNDFVALQELLLNRFPYRLVPSLPPKKMLISEDSHFLEERRRGLHRWLTLVCRHPVIYSDALVSFFLTDKSPEIQHRIRDIYRRAPDEFMTSDLAATAKDLLPPDHGQIAASREQIRSLVNLIGRLKILEEANIERQNASGRDFHELSEQLKHMSSLNVGQGGAFVKNWADIQVEFANMSRELDSISSKSLYHADTEQNAVEEKIALLLDILVAHKELCERLEKGLAHDHQVALSKMLSLKKRKIQGVIRGTDSESVEQLEAKMLAQESVISNIELRTDFSLYCVHMETKLVYTYLETMPMILTSLVNLNVAKHSEFLQLWKNIQEQHGNVSGRNGIH